MTVLMVRGAVMCSPYQCLSWFCSPMSAKLMVRPAGSDGNVTQPDYILANPIMRDQPQRWPGSGEIGRAVTKHDGVKVDAIFVDQSKIREACRQIRAGDFDLAIAPGLQRPDRALQIAING